MKIRFKFLIFLGAFLGGAFLIISWKSYNVFAQKYVEVSQQKETEVLDQMGFYLSQQLKVAESLFQVESPTVAQLSTSHIKLLAHVVNDGGRWKAQWHEGEAGIRSIAHGLTQQIPFESLSVVRPTWHFVNYKGRGQGVAYIIPGKNKDKAEFYTLFFDLNFFKEILDRGPSRETYAVVSPFVGEVFSSDKDANFSEFIEKSKKTLSQSQSGFLPISRQKYLSFVFNPDIQLYLVKTSSAPMLGVPQPPVLMTLGILAAFLLAIAIFAQDTLLKTIFNRVNDAVEVMKLARAGQEIGEESTPIYDELFELETLVRGGTKSSSMVATTSEHMMATQPETVTPEKKSVEAQGIAVTDKMKAMLINSLGYIQKIKQEPGRPSSYLTLLEAELRDLRRAIDPVSMTFDPFKAINNLSQENMPPVPNVENIESFIKDFKSRSISSAPTSSVADNSPLGSVEAVSPSLEIRKPKREAHGPKDV